MKLVLFISFILIGASSIAADEWELEKSGNGIKVYTRTAEDSDIKEFKAITNVLADRKSIAQVVTRVTDYPNWYPDCGESRVLDIISPTERKCYYRVDLPWPTSDRDCIMLMRVKVDNTKKTTTVYFSDTDPTRELNDDCVRMTQADGFWRIKELGDNKCQVTYQFESDPGGSLPAWLINMFIVDGPYDTLVALKEKVEK